MIYIMRHYEGGGHISDHAEDLLDGLDTLTVKRSWCYREKTSTSPFVEISIAPLERYFSGESFSAKGTVEYTHDEFARALFEVLKEHLRDAWKHGVEHFFFHSSGADSRVLSLALRELNLRPVFVCRYDEADSFHRILDAEGWDRGCRHVFGPKPIRFETAWADYGLVSIPVNLYKDIVTPGCVRAICGNWGNGLFRCLLHNECSVEVWFQFMASHDVCGRPKPADKDRMIIPYASRKALHCVSEARVPPINPETFRLSFPGRINPAIGMTAIPEQKMTAEMGFTIDPRPLQRAYDASWYGKQVPCEIPNRVVFHEAWSRFMLASWCEAHRGKVKIHVESV
jgi:hypothetical protein